MRSVFLVEFDLMLAGWRLGASTFAECVPQACELFLQPSTFLLGDGGRTGDGAPQHRQGGLLPTDTTARWSWRRMRRHGSRLLGELVCQLPRCGSPRGPRPYYGCTPTDYDRVVVPAACRFRPRGVSGRSR